METLRELQNWYESQCNDAWEHRYGLVIDTLDNPGWSLRVDLSGTYLEDAGFNPVSYGVDAKLHPMGHDWISCQVEERQFRGFGGPQKLEELISVFLQWASRERANAI